MATLVTQIDIQIGVQKMSLSLYEATELCNALSELFGSTRVARSGQDWIWDRQPGESNIVWDSAGSTYNADYDEPKQTVKLTL